MEFVHSLAAKRLSRLGEGRLDPLNGYGPAWPNPGQV
jgi:hypothetical protein